MLSRKIYIIIYFFAVLPHCVIGQAENGQVDSLEVALTSKTVRDTAKVNLLIDVARQYSTTNIEKLYIYAAEAYDLSDSLAYKYGKVKSLNLVAHYYWMLSDFQQSLDFSQRALAIATDIDDKEGVSESYYNIANVYREWGDYVEALNYLNKSLVIKSDIDDDKGKARIFNTLGSIYRIQGDYPKALDYCQKSLAIKEQIGDEVGMSTAYNNIGSVYYYQKNYPKALEYYHKSLQIAERLGDQRGVVTSYNNLGIVYFYQDEYDKALDYFQKAYAIQEETGDRTGSAISLINIGEIYTKQKDFDTAFNFYKRGFDLSKTLGIKSVEGWSYWGFSNIRVQQKRYKEAYTYAKQAYAIGYDTGEVELVQQSAEIISKASAAIGLYKEAYHYLQVFKTMSDSIQNEETTRRIVGLEYEYKFEKERIEQRRREAEQLAKYQRQRYYTITLIVGVTLMVVLVFIVLRNFRRKQRDLRVISEQKKEIEQKNFMLEQQQEEIKSQNENLQRWNNEVSTQNEKINHQKKMLEEQAKKLKEVDELKSRFFTNISHEFRTPLTLIIGPVERMLQRAVSNNDISNLRLIHRNAQNLLELINQLLYISRIEKGSIKLKFTKGDFCKEISFIVEMFKSHAEGKGLEMKFISCAEAIPAFFDREKLEWILFNLISNAIKNTDSGSITVSLQQDNPNTVQVTIADTGKGIEPEKLPYIFDRFYMTEEGGKMGSGIGLAFTNELVNVYKGTISVASEFGKGTTFTLTLPISTEVFAEHELDSFDTAEQKPPLPELQTEAESLAKHPEIARTKTGQSHAETILLVEDHDDLRHFIASSLSDKYRIIEAVNGKVGIELALKKLPDLIVTDVMMPEVDGIELTKTLKTKSETSHIPIVMLTAKASEDSKIEGLETEADDYLTKPFSYRELNVRIQNLLKLRRKLREKYMRSLEVNPSEITTNSLDEQFLKNVLKVVEENMSNPEFSVEQLCELAGIARTTLHNKLKSIVAQSATEFINSVRVKRAAQLIKQKAGTVSEIAYDVGFNSLSYFTKVFKRHFGELPSELH